MVRAALFAAFALLNAVVAAPPKHDDKDSTLFSLVTDDAQAANASLVDELLGSPVAAIPMKYDLPWKGEIPDQRRIPKIFQRQAVCSSSNYCGVTKSSLAYCPCNQQCCALSCCINGATCNGNSCAFKTVITSVTVTSTRTVFNDITITTTAAGGTVTFTSSVSSVTVVTVSSADVATVVSYATVTVAAKRALRDLRPAVVAEQPLETSTSGASSYNLQLRADNLAPQITQVPSSGNHLEKRQTVFVSTITSTIGTTTAVTTTTRLTTTTIAAQVTATSYTTFWQTVTSVVNAKRTTTTTSTITLTPGVRSVTVNHVVTTVLDNGLTTTLDNGDKSPTTTPVPGGGSSSTNNNNGGGSNSNSGSNNPPTNKGLSTSAQAGIGAGAAGGSLIICVILGFVFWRRRKTRKERNREMIDTAVTSAMAARDSVPPPPNQYYDGKQLSTATTSPHPYSPTPPLHSPQPSYVYPPPAPVYNQHNPIEFPDSRMDPGDQYRYSVPTYGGSEIDGSPVQRYELQQSSTPAPGHGGPYSDVPHPGAYATEPGRGGVQIGYSDLPEVRPEDGPEVRR